MASFPPDSQPGLPNTNPEVPDKIQLLRPVADFVF